MKVDLETLHKIAHLARLEVQPTEETALLSTLNGVLDWMEQLGEIDTTGVAPLMHLSEELENRLRPDAVANQLSRHQALLNAPDQDGEFIRVPKVMD